MVLGDDVSARPRALLVLGASGGVGREILAQAPARDFRVTAQTREAARLEAFRGTVRVEEGDPRDPEAVGRMVEGQDAVVSVLGVRRPGETDLFSQSTRHVLSAMERYGVPRLVVVTGVGAGETRGHGGFLYDWIGFPLFTSRFYRDKERQEALIEASGREWTIVRPAPYTRRKPPGELRVVTRVGPRDVLRRVAREEVAAFILECVEHGRHVGEKPFIGHP